MPANEPEAVSFVAISYFSGFDARFSAGQSVAAMRRACIMQFGHLIEAMQYTPSMSMVTIAWDEPYAVDVADMLVACKVSDDPTALRSLDATLAIGTIVASMIAPHEQVERADAEG